MSDFLGYQQHPIAEKFPLLFGEDFDALCNSMREGGFDPTQPIVLLDGAILDGRNRLRAANEVGVAPVFREWAGEMGSPVMWALQTNLARRHLSIDERAFIVMDSEIRDMLEQEAKVRKRSNLRRGNKRGSPEGRSSARRADAGKTAERLAKIAKVSPDTVKRAKAIVEHAPELKAEVLAGKKSMAAAAKEAVARKRTPPRVDVDNAEVEIRRRVATLATALRNSWPKHHALIARCLREEAKQ